MVWDDESGEMFWEEDEALRIEDNHEEVYSCNTRKDKDKRICRHTFGVLFGCSPCGVGQYAVKRSFFKTHCLVTIFDELFQSENVKQVYSIVTDWLASLDEADRKRIK